MALGLLYPHSPRWDFCVRASVSGFSVFAEGSRSVGLRRGLWRGLLTQKTATEITFRFHFSFSLLFSPINSPLPFYLNTMAEAKASADRVIDGDTFVRLRSLCCAPHRVLFCSTR